MEANVAGKIRSVPKNIFIVGAQSTGKTTLVNALDEYFTNTDPYPSLPVVIQETARHVLERHGFTRADISPRSPERALQLQQLIMDAQLEAEVAAIGKSGFSWFISDRSGLDPIVYAHVFVGDTASSALFDTSTWHQLEASLKAGTVFLCEAGWDRLVDDGTRLMPENLEAWLHFDQTFRQILTARGIDYRVIPKDTVETDARVAFVLAALHPERDATQSDHGS